VKDIATKIVDAVGSLETSSDGRAGQAEREIALITAFVVLLDAEGMSRGDQSAYLKQLHAAMPVGASINELRFD
jgi:hypothetical protein